MKQALAIAIFLAPLQLCGTTFYSHRSFSQEGTQSLINYANNLHYYSKQDAQWNTVTITPIYSHTIHKHDITHSLFKDDLFPFNGRDVIKISGTRVEERGPKDWLADYFGLRQDFSSFLSFNPFIENSVLDLEWFMYVPSNPCAYVLIHAPLVYTRWGLELIEHNVQTGCDTQYPPGYFADSSIFYQDITDDILFLGIPCRQLLCSFKQFISDSLSPNLVTPNNATAFESLQFSRISRDPITKTHLSEIQLSVGHSIIENYFSNFSLEGIIWIPTGNRPEGYFLFEPIVGNGHYWQAGIGVRGNYTLLHNACSNKRLTAYCYAYIAHPFCTQQTRTFDLYNSANSRYMLAQKMGTPTTNLLLDSQVPTTQFKGLFTPVANLTTLPVNVNIAWQTEITCMLQYRSNNVYLDLGYNYWNRSSEIIDFIKNCPIRLEYERWALKGDSFVYAFIPDDIVETEIANMPIALSPSQSNATIHAGTTRPIGDPPLEPDSRNSGVDNATTATLNDGTLLVYEPLLLEEPNSQQRSSLSPICLCRNDIDLTSAQTKGTSHTLFMHIGYTWSDFCSFVPSLGIGAMIEKAHSCATQNDVTFATPSQLAIWLKGGFTF